MHSVRWAKSHEMPRWLHGSSVHLCPLLVIAIGGNPLQREGRHASDVSLLVILHSSLTRQADNDRTRRHLAPAATWSSNANHRGRWTGKGQASLRPMT